MANEKLSQWIDGELDDADSARFVQGLLRDAEAREQCSLYWAIGDALRGDAPAGRDLTAGVMAALEDEPTVLAPPPARAAKQVPARWMSMAAAVAGVAVAGWMGLNLWSDAEPTQTRLAAQEGASSEVRPVSAAAPAQSAYLLAHQGALAGMPMAGVAQYVRPVSSEIAGDRP